MTTTTALPETYRRVTNIKKGYEIRTADGEWVEVVGTMHVTAPLNFVRLDLADGYHTANHPKDEVMSRRAAAAPSSDTTGA